MPRLDEAWKLHSQVQVCLHSFIISVQSDVVLSNKPQFLLAYIIYPREEQCRSNKLLRQSLPELSTCGI